MAQQREVLIKLKTIDEGSAKAINLISTALKNLQREIAKPASDSTDKTASYKSASYNSALKDIRRGLTENLRYEKVIAAEITRSDTITANNKVKEARRAANAVISSLNQIQRESNQSAQKTTSIFSSVLGGSFFGALGAKAVSTFTSAISSLPGIVAEIFTKSADFSQATVSLAQFSGSVGAAQEKILELTQVAAQTPGLGFLSAIDGQKRLQAVGFEADKATQILVGLAKVRLLSGSTKEDFNAVVLNLTQIATGGQKVGQEIRELIGRMPALGAVIRKEFGTLSGEVLNKIDPKEFVSRIAAATSTMNAEFASSSQAAENLGDAIDRIKIVVGSVIEQNPEVIALLRLWANEIDGVSGSLANQDSQQRSTFSGFISGLAKGLISIENYTDRSSANFQIFTNILSTRLQNASDIFGLTANGVLDALKGVAFGVLSIIATAIDTAVNGVQKSINGLVQAVNSVTFNIPGIPQLPIVESISNAAEELRKATTDSFERVGIAGNRFYSTLVNNSKRSAETQIANTKLAEKANIDSYNRTRIFNNLVERERKAVEKRKGQTFEKSGGLGEGVTTGAGGGKGRRSKSEAEKVVDSYLNAVQLRKIAEDLGFDVTSTTGGKHNVGSRHKKGLAVDVRTRDKSPAQIEFLIGELEKRGVFVSDERTRPKGQKVYGGPHLHLEDARLHGGRTQKIDDGFERFNANQSDEKTKAERDKQTRSVIELYKQFGLIPTPELLGDIQSLMVDEARKSGKIQPTKEAVANLFQANRDRLSPPQEQVGGRVAITTEFFDTRGAREYKAVIDELNEAVYQAAAGSEYYKTQKILESEATRNLTDDERANALAKANAIDAANVRRSLDEQLASARAANGGFSVYDETLKTLTTTYQNLTQATKDNLLATANVIDATNIRNGLDQQFEAALRGDRAITVYEETLKTLTTTYKNLSEAEKSELLIKASSIDAVKSAQESYAKLRNVVGESVQAFADGGFKGLFDSIKKRFKQFLIDLATDFLTSRFAKLFGGGGSASGGQQGGGLFGGLQNIFGGLLGDRSGGGSGSSSSGGINLGSIFGGNAGGGIFNFGGGSSTNIGGINTPTNLIRGSIGSGGESTGISGGGPLSGLLSPQGISGALATGGAAIAVQLLIASIQAKTPLQGLATGSLLGLGFGFLNRSKLRKKEEKLRTEYLQTSFKGLEGYDQLIKDVRTLRIDGASAISQGESLGSSIRTQYLSQANALTDKKTKNIALKDVSRIDTIIAQKMEELRKAADVANSAKLRADRIIPEFAHGMFFGRDDQMRDIFKSLDTRRGYINGGRLGVDRHLGLFADGEAILNRQHQANINRAAGFDVMAHAGVPNYPKGKASRSYADGNLFGSGAPRTPQAAPPIVIENITLQVSSLIGTDAATEVFVKGATTEAGQKVIVKNVQIARKNREI